MTPCMAGALALIRPHLSPLLVSAETFERIEKMAASFPPTYWGGFECHLDKGPARVDFHQGYNCADELERLVTFSGPGAGPADQGRPFGLRGLSAQWARAGTFLAKEVESISLEFDVAESFPGATAPSVFLFLSRPITLGPIGNRTKDLVRSFLFQLYSAETAEKTWETLAGLAPAAEGPAIGYLGAMTSRKTGALRLVIPDLSAGTLAEFSSRLAPSAAGIAQLVSKIEDCTGAFALNLDVLPGAVSSRIGVECYPKQRNGSASSWRELLGRLTDMGFCSRAQGCALYDWQGLTTPESAGAPWPRDLIAASLLQPPFRFSAFSRMLSHVKIDLHPSKAPRAKAYLEFLHRWIDMKESRAEAAGPAPARDLS